MATTLRKIFSYIIMFQIILFLFFMIENVDNLSSVGFNIVVNGETETVEINFYSILLLLGVLFLIVIIAGINLFGIGLNEEGTRNVAKYLSLIGMLTVLTFTSAYFILQFGTIGLITELTFAIIYLFYVLESIQASVRTEI